MTVDNGALSKLMVGDLELTTWGFKLRGRIQWYVWRSVHSS